jgi:serine/threonine-protein kinase RsbW
MTAEPVTAAQPEHPMHAGTYPGHPDQVARARRDVARHMAGHPAADDLVLIVSELAANAILHSHSKGQSFTVRAGIYPGYVWLEVEDLGGHWNLKPRDADRPHGLDVVEALAGPDNWGTDGTEGGRVVWCRLELEARR